VPRAPLAGGSSEPHLFQALAVLEAAVLEAAVVEAEVGTTSERACPVLPVVPAGAVVAEAASLLEAAAEAEGAPAARTLAAAKAREAALAAAAVKSPAVVATPIPAPSKQGTAAGAAAVEAEVAKVMVALVSAASRRRTAISRAPPRCWAMEPVRRCPCLASLGRLARVHRPSPGEVRA